jgi:hypothetical protein
MNPKDIQISICTRVTEAKYSDFRVLITSVQYKIASFMNITNCYKNKTPKKKKTNPPPKKRTAKNIRIIVLDSSPSVSFLYVMTHMSKAGHII